VIPKPKILLTILLVAASSFLLDANTDGDSLAAKIKKLELFLSESKSAEDKVDLYNELAWEVHRTDIAKCEEYCNEARILASQIQYQKGYARSLNLLAIVRGMQDYPLQSLSLNEEALEIAKEIQDSFLLAATYNDIGIYYAKQMEYSKSIEYLLNSAEYLDKQDYMLMAGTHGNIEGLYRINGNLDAANGHFEKVQRAANLSNDPKISAYVAQIEIERLIYLKEYDAALVLLKKQSEKHESENDYLSMIQSLMRRGQLLDLQENHLEALRIKTKTRNLIDAKNFDRFQSDMLAELSESFYHLKKFNKAIELQEEAISLSNTNEGLEAKYKFLIDLHEAQNDSKAALSVYKKILPLRDSIAVADNKKSFEEYQIMYDLKKKETENKALRINQLNSERELQERKNTILFLVAFAGILGLALFYFYLSHRKKKKFQAILKHKVAEKTSSLRTAISELHTKNEELEKFNRVAAHDLKTPIRNIISFNGLLSRKLSSKLDPKEKEYLGFIKNNANWMNQLLNDLVVYSKASQANLIEEFSTKDFISDLRESVAGMIIEHEAVLVFGEYPEVIFSDSEDLKEIMKNLISNGIKFCKEDQKPFVEINMVERGAFLEVSIQDNGIGLKQDYFQSIFEPFNRLNPDQVYSGTGIGLAICKKMVVKLGGEIGVESSLGQGCRFIFTLPLRKKPGNELEQKEEELLKIGDELMEQAALV